MKSPFLAKDPPGITIVGGGLIGPAMAVALAAKKISSLLVEKSRLALGDSGEEGRSINITLCERGLRALEAIDLREAAEANSNKLYGRVLHRGKGVTFLPYGQDGEALYSISRHKLRDLLLQKVRREPLIATLENATCLEVDLAERLLTLGIDGIETKLAYSRLIGADGVNSRIRAVLGKNGFIHETAEKEVTGYREFLIGPEQARRLNLSSEALHIWPREEQMLLGFPNPDGSLTLSLHMKVAGSFPSFERLDSPRATREFIKTEYFSDEPITAQEITGTWARHPGTMVTVKCSRWSYGDEVVLVGDAAHSLVPSYGQGANAGFEDAIALANGIAEASELGQRGAFAKFEAGRKEQTDLMADLCIQHLGFLRAQLNNHRVLQRQAIEQSLYKSSVPLRSLYHQISFSCSPYTECYRKAKAFTALVDRIEARLASPDDCVASDGDDRIKAAVDQVVSEYHLVEHPTS